MTQFDDVTEDLPLEFCSITSLPSESPRTAGSHLELLDSSSLVTECSGQEEENDELTIIELPQRTAPQPKPRFYHYLHPAYSPSPLAEKLKPYFREVRRRIRESKEFDRLHYANAPYQKLRRAALRVWVHVKTNLST